jgi:hypothetical protein
MDKQPRDLRAATAAPVALLLVLLAVGSTLFSRLASAPSPQREIAGYATSLKGRTASQRHNARLAALALDGRVIAPLSYFMTDREEDVFTVSTGSPADIVAIIPDDRTFIVAHEDGTVCGIDRATLEITCKQRTGTRIGAAGGLPWLGSTRLLLAPDGGAVQCVGLDDPLVTQYGSAHRGLRAVAGSHDLVAGVSADRQRLILWKTWDGKQPAAEIYMTGVTRHRMADVDFG